MIVGAGFVSVVPFTVTFNAVVLSPFGTMMSNEPLALEVPVTVKFRLFGVELIWRKRKMAGECQCFSSLAILL
jgi:hypothetical protein